MVKKTAALLLALTLAFSVPAQTPAASYEAGRAETEAEAAFTETVTETAQTEAETETEMPVMSEAETEAVLQTLAETEAETETEQGRDFEGVFEEEEDPGYAAYEKAAAVEAGQDVLLYAGSGGTRKIKAIGIDVWRGNGDIDWKKVKAAGVQFAIIRVGFQYQVSGQIEEDMNARKNLAGANAAGIPVGVYFYSVAATKEEVIAQADLTLNVIRDYKISYPVVYDCEGYDEIRSHNYYLGARTRTDLALTFLSYIEDHGYEGMMYSSSLHFRDREGNDSSWETSRIDPYYDIWVAQYYSYDHTSFADVKDLYTSYTGDYRMWQFSAYGRVDGIDGNVDLNIEYYSAVDQPQLSDYDLPEALTEGGGFKVTGTVSAEAGVDAVSAKIMSPEGKVLYEAARKPGKTSFDLSVLDSKLPFSRLSPGVYRYMVTAENIGGPVTLINHTFAVLNKDQTLEDGLYRICVSSSRKLCMTFEGGAVTEGAPVLLSAADKMDDTQIFKLTHQGNGWYRLQNYVSQAYLTPAGGSDQSRTGVVQSSQAMQWQLIPCGSGLCLLPRCAPACVADVTSGKVAAGTRIQSYRMNGTAAEQWAFEEAVPADLQVPENTAPKISGQSIPGTIKAGTAFNVIGRVMANPVLTNVTAGIYDYSGKAVRQETAKPGKMWFDLSGMSEALNFAGLAPGAYRYKVTAASSLGTSTLIDKVFIVLASERTISDGVYNIVLSDHTGYGLHTAADSLTSGANTELWQTSGAGLSGQYEMAYEKDGFYMIRNIRSGQYLSVAGLSSANDANVIQSSTVSRWQILPCAGSGYVLVPRCSDSCVLDLKMARVANGSNIQSHRANLSAAECWQLLPVKAETPLIRNHNVPGTRNAGTSFKIKGLISANSKISKVTAGVYNAGDEAMLEASAAPGKSFYQLSALAGKLDFTKLPTGLYRYRVSAESGAGTSVLVNKVFIVLGKSATVANGSYRITVRDNNAFGLGVAGNSAAAGANIELQQMASANTCQTFKVTYQSDGYYRISCQGSKKYLGVAGLSSANDANIEQASTYTLWQIVPYSTGGYALVPRCSKSCVLDLKMAKVAAGTNLQSHIANLTAAEAWDLAPASAAKPTLSGQTLPGTLAQGSAFSIRGRISCSQKLTSVTAGVYDAAGTMKIGRTVSPNAQTYDLEKLDSSLKFGSLTGGLYRYRVSARSAAGTTILADSVFIVTTSDRTVEDGTVSFVLKGNNAYGLHIAGNSKSAGANVELMRTSAAGNYGRFTVTYQGNGYYRIKNAGSGLDLGVASQSSSNDANIEQQTSGTLWQILPYGNGAYALVPACATRCVADLKMAKIADRSNIQSHIANLTEAEMWVIRR